MVLVVFRGRKFAVRSTAICSSATGEGVLHSRIVLRNPRISSQAKAIQTSGKEKNRQVERRPFVWREEVRCVLTSLACSSSRRCPAQGMRCPPLMWPCIVQRKVSRHRAVLKSADRASCRICRIRQFGKPEWLLRPASDNSAKQRTRSTLS